MKRTDPTRRPGVNYPVIGSQYQPAMYTKRSEGERRFEALRPTLSKFEERLQGALIKKTTASKWPIWVALAAWVVCLVLLFALPWIAPLWQNLSPGITPS
jgi:hypothetical protein